MRAGCNEAQLAVSLARRRYSGNREEKKVEREERQTNLIKVDGIVETVSVSSVSSK